MNYDNRNSGAHQNHMAAHSANSNQAPVRTGYQGNNYNPDHQRRPYDPTDNKWRGYRNSYAIYPDYWKQSWGPRPLLGYVKADSAFNAKYAAYDAGLLIVNGTFGPEPVLQIRRQPQYQPDNNNEDQKPRGRYGRGN